MGGSDYTVSDSRIGKDGASSPTWQENCNVNDALFTPKTDKLIISIFITTAAHTPTAETFRLQFSNESDNPGSYSDVISGSGEIRSTFSAGALVNATTVNNSAGCQSTTDSEEVENESPMDSTNISIAKNAYAEIQFCVDLSNGDDTNGDTYQFRLWSTTAGAAVGTTVTVTLQGVLTNSVQLLSDGRIKAPVFVQLLSDGRVKDTYSVQLLSDGAIKKVNSVQLLSDGRVKDTYSIQILSDGRVKDTYSVQLLSDGAIVVKYFVQLFSDGRIKDTYSVQLLSDGAIKIINSVQLISDGRIKDTYSVQLLSDGAIKIVNFVQLLSDAKIISAKVTYSIQLLSDGRIKRIESIQLLSDGKIITGKTIDYLAARITKTKILSANIRKTKKLEATINKTKELKAKIRKY